MGLFDRNPEGGALAAPAVQVSGGGGEVNTASNLGGGAGIFASKSGVDLQFKSLVAGTNITLTPSGTTITIDAAGGGGDDLGAVAEDIIPVSNATYSIGSSSFRFNNVYAEVLDLNGNAPYIYTEDSTYNTGIYIAQSTTLGGTNYGRAINFSAIFEAGYSGQNLGIHCQDGSVDIFTSHTGAGSKNIYFGTGNSGGAASGSVFISSGTSTSSATGDISITTGTTSGTRGQITFGARKFTFTDYLSLDPVSTTLNDWVGGTIPALVFDGTNASAGNGVFGLVMSAPVNSTYFVISTSEASSASATNEMYVKTGNNTGAGASGTLTLTTGDSTSGASGDIYIQTGANVGTTRGNIRLTANQYEVVDFGTFSRASAGANNFWGSDIPALVLDGTSSEAVAAFAYGIILNAAAGTAGLVIGTTQVNSANNSGDINLITGLNLGSGGSGPMYVATGSVVGANLSGAMLFETGDAHLGGGTSGPVEIRSGLSGAAGASGYVKLKSGNNGAGDSGDVRLEVGTATGTKGKVKIFNSSQFVIGKFSADPSNLEDGEIWYNTTSNELKARVNGTTVVLA